MGEHVVLSITLILVLGIGAQWLAWRLRIPSILLLLTSGFLAGPVLGWVEPDALLGDLLMPLVSISVALILFEGGLTLKLSEWREVGKLVRNLISIGALASWGLCTVAAHYALDWPWSLSTLLGAILVVTGPTVIMPLLRHVQPERDVRSTLKWEGILIDPVGAFLAVLVFEAIVAKESAGAGSAIVGFVKSVIAGGVIGAIGARIMIFMFRRYLVPDFLQNAVSLMMVVACFTASNQLAHESGLLATTVMGIILANRSDLKVHHIVEFKENLRVLLISGLFIILSARLKLEQFDALNFIDCAIFLAILVVVVRPLSVMASAAGLNLGWRKKAFLSWMAPRGIVAAAVASLFSLRLIDAGYEQAEQLVPVTFLVIVFTVALYGSTASAVAKGLKLSQPNPQGVLIVGAGLFARRLAEVVTELGFRVTLVDTNRENFQQCRQHNLPVVFGNILSEQVRHDLDLGGIGKIFALTPNHEVNTLSLHHYREFFGNAECYQSATTNDQEKPRNQVTLDIEGRRLFKEGVTSFDLANRLAAGSVIKKTPLTEKFTFADFEKHYGVHALPLMLITEDQKIQVFTTDQTSTPKPGQTLISLVAPTALETPVALGEPGDSKPNESK